MKICPMRKPDSPAARTFDETAEIYERARPGWPVEALDDAGRELGVLRTATVLDVGAGTGKLTRMLVERFGRVVAVEPLEGMRVLLESLVPQADVLAGRAEIIPLANNSVDAVFSAEGFHWFDGDVALAEIERVLRPHGGLILMWNVPAKPTEPPIAAAAALLEQRGAPERQVNRYDSGEWREPFVGSRFEELHQAQYEHTQTVDREQLLAYFASMSWVAVLHTEERADLLKEVRGLLDADAYTRFWRTDLYWTRLGT
jgi:ubiquinone/menaquinone biosynthesis C-methylase UbiE